MESNKCTRCGMCCIAAPDCGFGEEDHDTMACKYLYVHGDMTTSCLNKDAVEAFVGRGCFFACPEAKEIYDLHMESYSVNEKKKELREMRGGTQCQTMNTQK